MTIGPAPMIRIEEMSVRLGILWLHQLAFPAVVVAVEFIAPCLHSLRVCLEALGVDRYRCFEHEAVLRGGWTGLISGVDRRVAELVDATAVEEKQRVARYLAVVAAVRQHLANLGVSDGVGRICHRVKVLHSTMGTQKKGALSRVLGLAGVSRARALFRPL